MARDYGREYEAALERARRRGFRSLAEQRRAPRILRRPEDFAALPEAARESRSASAAALARSREARMPLEVAAAIEGVRVSTVRYWFPNAVGRTRRARTRPTKSDRYLRLRPLAVDGEVRFIAVRGSRVADEAIRAFGVQYD